MDVNSVKIIISLLIPFLFFPLKLILLKRNEDRQLKLLSKLTQIFNEEKINTLEASIIFYQATKIRMNTRDIENLMNDENAIYIVYFLGKYPQYVEYSDKKLNYKHNFKSNIFRKIQTRFFFISEWFFLALTIIAILLFVFSENNYQVIYSIVLSFSYGFAWYLSRNLNEEDSTIEKLISGENK